jgi:hypothetical protein
MAPTPFQAGLPTQTIIQHGTDLVTLPWYQFFLQLYNRTGGGTGSITLQLAALNGQYPGNTGNLGANPGNIGEYPTPGHGTLVPFTISGDSYDVAHIDLLDGDWDVWGSFVSTPAGGTTQSEIRAWINTASATDPGAPNSGALCDTPAVDRGRVIPMPASGLDAGRGRSDSVSDSERDICGIDVDGRGIHSGPAPELRRSADAVEFNAILNHPDILPMVSVPGQESLDATPLVDDPKNYLLAVDGATPAGMRFQWTGAILFAQHDPGIFEVHTNFLKGWRGQFAVEASLAAYRWMFTHTDAMTLLARAPDCWPQVGKFCEAVGATFEFARPDCWPGPDGPSSCDFYALRYDDWVIQNYAALADSASGFPLASIENYVGVFVETLYGGQPDKAVILYNRFARFGGFPGIALLARDPVIIDIGTAVLQIGEGTFKVLKVRT